MFGLLCRKHVMITWDYLYVLPVSKQDILQKCIHMCLNIEDFFPKKITIQTIYKEALDA